MDSQQVLRSLVVVLAVISWPPVSCKPAKIMSDGTVDLAQIVRCRLLSDNSGRFVGVGPQNTLHAMGNYEDPRTVFVPRHTLTGKVAFEVACSPGQFILFQNMTLRVGSPSNNNELFEQHSPYGSAVAYQPSAVEEHECYIAFNGDGYPYDDQMCMLDTRHRATLFMYIEAFEQVQCEEESLLLRSLKKEL